MNILHYSLGLPPYRTGGLTKYSFDLMNEQIKNGDKVCLLFPGRISLISNKTKIRYYKNQSEIMVYEIINPLPVPLLNGISNPQKFMKPCDKELFKKFLKENKVQIVHIHSLMGLHIEFLLACDDLNIKKVYTTHDYFGFCTKVNFIDSEGDLCEERNLEKCLRCNESGYSMRCMMILQSRIYRLLKDKGIISKLIPLLKRLKRNRNAGSIKSNLEIVINPEYKYEYCKLIKYYNNMFNCIDKFLFNSTVTKKIYNQYIGASGNIVPITHRHIKDNRKIKLYEDKKLKLTYLGPDKKYKGFNLLIDIMKELNIECKSNIELNLYGDINLRKIDDNIKIHGRYSYDQLENIFDNTDLLIVPSIWNETFGFITLEALSYGVPVLLTNKVGSKDLLYNNGIQKGIITSASKEEILKEIIQIFNDRSILKKLNNNILNDSFYNFMNLHYNNVNSEYLNILGE